MKTKAQSVAYSLGIALTVINAVQAQSVSSSPAGIAVLPKHPPIAPGTPDPYTPPK